MKMRWSNGHSYALEFEANDPETFQDNAMSALRSFRIATERRVHRGEIGKTVSWCDSARLHVWCPETMNWAGPEGEAQEITTESFGTLSINRIFTVHTTRTEFDDRRAACSNYDVLLICHDPMRTTDLNLAIRSNSDQVWNMLIEAYQRAKDVSFTISTFVDDMKLCHDKNDTEA